MLLGTRLMKTNIMTTQPDYNLDDDSTAAANILSGVRPHVDFSRTESQMIISCRDSRYTPVQSLNSPPFSTNLSVLGVGDVVARVALEPKATITPPRLPVASSVPRALDILCEKRCTRGSGDVGGHGYGRILAQSKWGGGGGVMSAISRGAGSKEPLTGTRLLRSPYLVAGGEKKSTSGLTKPTL